MAELPAKQSPKSSPVLPMRRWKPHVEERALPWHHHLGAEDIALATIACLSQLGIVITSSYALYNVSDDDEAASYDFYLALLDVTAAFNIMYVLIGVLWERYHYLLALAGVSTLLMIFITADFVLTSHATYKIILMVLVWLFSPNNVILALKVALKYAMRNSLIEKLAGPKRRLQRMMKSTLMTLTLLVFDLQISMSLLLFSFYAEQIFSTAGVVIVFAVGAPANALYSIFAYLTVRRENNIMFFITMFLCWPILGYAVYVALMLVIESISLYDSDSSVFISSTSIIFLLIALITVITRMGVSIAIAMLHHDFGSGINELLYPSPPPKEEDLPTETSSLALDEASDIFAPGAQDEPILEQSAAQTYETFGDQHSN